MSNLPPRGLKFEKIPETFRMATKAVWVIDNDLDEEVIVQKVWEQLAMPYELRYFQDADSFMEALADEEVSPFIIICDYNLGVPSGLELRRQMLSKHEQKYESVPFIFWSNSAGDRQITAAYDVKAHGFFVKDPTLSQLKETFADIIRYWSKSKMPPKNVNGNQ